MDDEQPSDDLLFEDLDALSSVTTLEPEAETLAPAADCAEPRCEKCDSLLKSDVVTICRRCGWYASLGTFVELDPNWETETEDAESPADAPEKSHLQVWLELVPRWGWVIIGSVLAVVAQSVIARLATPGDGGLRTTWSLCQLTAGVLLAVGCHVFNFVVLAAADADFGVMDLFLKPLKLWIRAIQNLPTRLWVANSAACGVTAALMSVLVIGGLPYERLWDWGFQEPVKQDLMGAVMDRVKQLDSRNGADSLEEAIGDFAGSQDLQPGADPPTSQPSKPRGKADCVILGYQLDREGRLAALLLGTAHRSKLIYAGRVAPILPDEELRSLLKSLESVKSMQAFIRIETQGTWVHPKYACRITFDERLKNGQLRDIQWDSLLGGIATPKD